MIKKIISALLILALMPGIFAFAANAAGSGGQSGPFVKFGDGELLEVKKDDYFYAIVYTCNPKPVGSAWGGMTFAPKSFTEDESYRKICYADEERGELMSGSVDINVSSGFGEFDLSASQKDISLFDPFAVQQSVSGSRSVTVYAQPLLILRFKMNSSSGELPISANMAFVRDIDGKLLYDTDRSFQADGFSYGVICTNDDPLTYEPETEALRGDANGDGEINNRDAMILDRYVAGWAGYEERIADMDALDLSGDGQVNNRDAMILDRYVAGWQGYDKYFDGSTEPEKPAEPEKPTVPTITKVESGNSGVIIKWDAFEGAELYRVFYKTGANSWKSLGDTASTSFTHADAPYDTECRYTVRCVDKNGNFTSDYDKTGYLNTRLKNPTLKSATLMNYFIGVSWDKVSGAKAYRVYIKGGQYTSWTWIYDCDTNYIDIDAGLLELESNTKYSFTVRCLDDLKGDRLVSGYDTKGVSVKYYESPFIYGLVCTGDGIEIYWDEVEGVSKYRVFEWTDGGWKKLTDLENTAILVTGLTRGSYYRFTVRGLDSSGEFLTPYDPYGRSIRWYSSVYETEYSANGIIREVSKAAVNAGFSPDKDAPTVEDEVHYFFLDSTFFYEGTDSLDRPIEEKSASVVAEIAKMIKRSGDSPSEYSFDILAEADEYDELWFYFSWSRLADAE